MVVRNESWIPMVGDHIKPILDRRNLWLGPGRNWPKGLSSGITEKASAVNIEPLPAQPSDNDASAVSQVSLPTASTHGDGAKESQNRVIQSIPRINRICAHQRAVDAIDYDNTFSHTGSFEHHVTRDQHNFHGKALIPPGYSWVEVHADTKISWAEPRSGVQGLMGGPPSISSNYNWIQSLAAIFQAGSAGWALYKARGNQIQRYGYAAFGLTVIPYLFMSVMNLLAQIATANYPNVYMVSSPEMEEARRHGGVFDGVVGRLEPEVKDDEAENPVYVVKSVNDIPVMERVSGSSYYPLSIPFGKRVTSLEDSDGDIQIDTYTPYKLHTTRLSRGCGIFCFQFCMLPIILGCLSLIVVGAMTHFGNGESTKTQRGWIMSWLVVGGACGWYTDAMSSIFIPEHDKITGKVKKSSYFGNVIPFAIIFLGILCVPAIGGFVVVARMLEEYGICESK